MNDCILTVDEVAETSRAALDLVARYDTIEATSLRVRLACVTSGYPEGTTVAELDSVNLTRLCKTVQIIRELTHVCLAESSIRHTN